jgi:hypothetical protein
MARGSRSRRFAQRTQALHGFDAKTPGFVAALIAPTYLGYYQEPRVVLALGLDPRPPHPKGHVLEPGDLSLLGAVLGRGKIYRQF